MSTSTDHIRLVAERELRSRLFTPAFLIGLGVTAALIVGVFSLTNLIPDDPTRIGLVGDQPAGAVEALDALEGDDVEVVTLASLDGDPADVLDEEGLDALVVDGDRIVLLEEDAGAVASIEAAWSQARLVERLGDAGLDDAQIAASLEPLTVDVLDPDADSGIREASGFITVLVLFLAIQVAGAYIMMGIMEEKGTKIVELILSSVSARDLLVGKVLGIGVLGLVQIAVLIGAFAVAAVVNDIDLPQLQPSVIALGLVWFVLGYLFYGSLFAAGASLAPRQEDAQATLAPVTVVTMLSYFASIIASTSPDAEFSRWIAFVPTVAPFAFPARMATGDAQWWETLLAFGLTAATTALVFSIAARIYTRSVLHTDRKLGWAEGFRLRT